MHVYLYEILLTAPDGIETGKEYSKRELFTLFIDGNDKRAGHRDQFGKLTPRTFSKWLRLYEDYDKDIEKTEERSSNGEYLITYFKTAEAMEADGIQEAFNPDWKPETPLR